MANQVRLGKRGGIPSLSTSGTGASNQFAQILNSIKNFGFDEATLQNAIKKARTRTEKRAIEAIVKKKAPEATRLIMQIPLRKRGNFFRALKGAQVKSIGDKDEKAK